LTYSELHVEDYIMNKRMAAIMSLLVALLLGTTVLVNNISSTSHAAVLAQGGGATAYLPFITRSHVFDLAITNIEMTQSVQTLTNNVPLVAQRHALVRVYAQTVEGTSPPNVVVTLEGIRNGVSLGLLTANPRPIPANPSQADLASTVNFVLPPAWRTGAVTLIARIEISDANPGNNVRQHVATFNNVPQLRVFIVPINYTHQGSNAPGFYPAQSVDYISNWIQRAFPVHNVQITMRDPYNFTGNLQTENGWRDLLWAMTFLKQADGYSEHSPIFYYGFVPINNGSTQWFTSGIAGIGWVSPSNQAHRESVGLNLGQNDNTGILAAHEFGHNMTRKHAPCGNPADVDPNYPYTGASIGQFGYDIGVNALRNPATYKDVMSYCSPEWVSDYTYNGLYNDQMLKGNWPDQAETTSQQLLIRANLDETGVVEMRPTYHLATSGQTQPLSVTMYEVQLLDEAGTIIAQHPISLREAEEPGIVVRGFMGTVPLPAEPVASVQIVSLAGESPAVLAGQTLTTRALAARTEASLTETADSIHLTWSDSSRPAIVRYTGDDGATWTALAIDHLGGELTVAKEWLGGGLSLAEQDNGRFEIILANGTNANVLTLER
jgi:hypothetical protein